MLAALLKMAFQIRNRREMVEHQRASGCDHDDDFLNARGNRFFDHHLDRGAVDDRQNFLGDDAGGWQHARAKSGRHHHGLANFHKDASGVGVSAG